MSVRIELSSKAASSASEKAWTTKPTQPKNHFVINRVSLIIIDQEHSFYAYMN